MQQIFTYLYSAFYFWNIFGLVILTSLHIIPIQNYSFHIYPFLILSLFLRNAKMAIYDYL